MERRAKEINEIKKERLKSFRIMRQKQKWRILDELQSHFQPFMIYMLNGKKAKPVGKRGFSLAAGH